MPQSDSALLAKFAKKGPKKILALDGGGIRGILTLGMLKKIETVLREKNPDLLLGDYYDLIGGTSTGAIIACGLAIGKSVDEIIKLYQELGSEIFGKGRNKKFLKRDWKILRSFSVENYSSSNLEEYLYSTFKEIHLGDNENIKCGLAINGKRADTYSLWTVANHPDGIYFNSNAHLKLWEVCRASSAAPYYFKPKKLVLRNRKGQPFDATFIDGGVSLANNPAWETFLVATVPSFGFKWDTGENMMSITSLGTGNGAKKEDPHELEKLKAVSWASKLADVFMNDALEMNHVLMELLGVNKGPQYTFNSQYGNGNELQLIKDKNSKLFSFIRHNVTLSVNDLKNISVDADTAMINSLIEMDHYENMDKLLEIGEKYAAANINANTIL